jgi:TRAP-type C4-dicarboxylate transport system permease large subunit
VAIKPEAGPKGGVPDRREFIEATAGMIPVLLIFALVIGGIYFGFFNPTPAAAAGVFLVLVFGLLQRKLSWPDMLGALKETAATSGMIYLIILGAELLKIFMSRVACLRKPRPGSPVRALSR